MSQDEAALLGQLMNSQAGLCKKVDKLTDDLAKVDRNVTKLAKEQHTVAVATRIGKWVVPILLSILLPILAYFYHAQHAQGQDQIRLRQELVATTDAIGRHERAVGHEGTRAQVVDTQGDIRVIKRDITAVQAALTRIEQRLAEPPRRRR